VTQSIHLLSPPVRGLRARALDLIFPPRCVGIRDPNKNRRCGKAGHWICPRCWETIKWLGMDECARCAGQFSRDGTCASCLSEGASVSVRAVAQFEGAAREAVHALKYAGHTDIASVLGPLMADRLPADTSAIIPVPLHFTRRHQRGFNQAEVLARYIAKHRGIRVLSRSLRRVRRTDTQVSLTAKERRANVAGAFQFRGRLITGPVLLLDDVLTTGATLDACSETLRQAGLGPIYGIVFATQRYRQAAPTTFEVK
jgi:ComF family protein